MNPARTATNALALALLVVAAGCGGGEADDVAAEYEPPATTTAATPTTTTQTLTPEQQEAAREGARQAEAREERKKKRKREKAEQAGSSADSTEAAGAGAGSSSGGGGRAVAVSGALKGTLTLAPGSDDGGQPSGSYFRMILPGGGKFFKNPDSRAQDKSYTLIAPGTAGGLAVGRFQPGGGFDKKGNSRSGAIIRPTSFTGIKFGLATQAKDPQSGRAVSAPRFSISGRSISGSLAALTANWNNQFFNQGSPKPGDATPKVSGTYDPGSGAFVLEWKSRIRGGPFNNFTGSWHLAGTYRP